MYIDRTTKPEPGIGLRKGHWSTDGILGHWAFNERGGLRAYDLSGKGNHGNFVNTPLWDAGRDGPAVEFPGTDEYVVIVDNGSLDLFRYTITAWIFPYSVTPGDRFPIWANFIDTGASPFNGVVFSIESNSKLRIFENNASPAPPRPSVTGDTELLVNKWQHVAVTTDGSIGFLYLNGQADGSGALNETPVFTACTPVIGKETANVFYGLIDYLSIYNHALLPAEVAALAHNSNIVYEPEWIPDVVAPAVGISMPLVMQQMNQFDGGGSRI